MAALHTIRKEALNLPEQERRTHYQRLLSPERITAVAKKTFKKNTAIGADQMAFRDIANSPLEAIITLSELLIMIAMTQALPIQTLINIMSMLGKKSGYSRAIAIGCTIIRLLLTLLSCEWREWDAAHSNTPGVTDTAAPGTEAAKATVIRMAQIEAAHATGHTVIIALWDIKQFFGSITMPQLIEDTHKLALPCPWQKAPWRCKTT